jgi:integrase
LTDSRFAKLHERERHATATKEERIQRLVPVGLNATSINKCLALLARILDEALDYGHIERNPAKGRSRRLKPIKPPRTFLEPHEAQAVLDAGGKYRPLLATMMLAGLRVGELTALRWRDVDLAGGKLRVAEAKTEAGVRVVDMSPMLREELVLHRANSQRQHSLPGRAAFPCACRTRDPRQRRACVVAKAVERANEALAEAGLPLISDGITNHSLRRTFASLLYEAGASPAYVMSQMGHTSASLALEVYAKKMARSRDTGERMDALLRAADWAGEKAQKGANGADAVNTFTEEKTEVVH